MMDNMYKVQLADLCDEHKVDFIRNETVKAMLSAVFGEHEYVLVISDGTGLSVLSNSETFGRMADLTSQAAFLLSNVPPDEGANPGEPPAPERPKPN